MRPLCLGFALLMLSLPPVAHGCTFAKLPDWLVEVRPDFRVVVDHLRRPLPGAAVAIQRKNDSGPVFSGVTDADGRLDIAHLSPGEYSISVQALGIPVAMLPSMLLEVKAKPTKKGTAELGFDWGLPLRRIREVSGTLVDTKPYDAWGPRRDPTFPLGDREQLSIVGLRISSASLRLRDVFSGVELSTVSDAEGNFKFPEVPDGSYVLHIEGGESWNRYQPARFGILVDSTLANSEGLLFMIDLRIPWICGGGEDGIETLSLAN